MIQNQFRTNMQKKHTKIEGHPLDKVLGTICFRGSFEEEKKRSVEGACSSLSAFGCPGQVTPHHERTQDCCDLVIDSSE